MSRVRLGTSWPHLAPLVMTLLGFLALFSPSLATKFDVSEIITSIYTGTRSVLLFAPLPTRILVIISSPGTTLLDEKALVFDESLDRFANSKMYLTTPQLFTDKWTELPSSGDTLGILHDIVNGISEYYMVVSSAGNLNLFSLERKFPSTISLSAYTYRNASGDVKDGAQYFAKGNVLLYSLGSGDLYFLHVYQNGGGNMQDLTYASFTQDNEPLSSATEIKDVYSGLSQCISTGGQVGWTNSADQYSWCPNTSGNDGQANGYWQSTAGYLTESTVFLFDRLTKSVVTFPVAAFNGAPVSYETFSYGYFFNEASTKKVSARPKAHHTTSGFYLSHRWMIIIVSSVSFLILLVIFVTLLIRWFCRRPSQQSTQLETPQVTADGQLIWMKAEVEKNQLMAQQPKALRKPSKRVASRLCAPAGAAGKRPRTSKGTPTKYRLVSGKFVPYTSRTSLQTPGSQAGRAVSRGTAKSYGGDPGQAAASSSWA